MQSSLIQEVERDRRKANIHSFAWADPFAINFEDKHYDEFDDASLVATAGSCMVLDCESYTNYFLAAFKETSSKKVIYFEDDNEGKLIDVVKLNWVLHHYTQVGFNSRNYDLVLLAMALKGYRAADLKQVSNDLIYNQRHFTYKSEYECEQFNVKVEIPRIDHIDLIEVAPLMGSLKIYAGRLHCQRMQELPLEHTKVLEPVEKKAVKLYCINDLDNTALMLEALKPAIELRYQLSNEIKEDLRSKSDAKLQSP
jgi:hypothetical protein